MHFPLLSGSDYFHLLIDRKMKRLGMPGNISRMHFELDQAADLRSIAEDLRKNVMFQEVCAIRYRLRWPLFPVWEKRKGRAENIDLRVGLSAAEFDRSVLNRRVDNEVGLVWIDLCEFSDGSKHVVISMHHALFDHQGMVNFIHALNNDFVGPFFPEKSSVSRWEIIADCFYMTVYMLGRHAWKLGSLLPRKPLIKVSVDFDELSFNRTEAEKIDRRAWQVGSRIGTSTYMMAAMAVSVHHTLLERGHSSPYLFFSVPHSMRRLGSRGHLCSNRLSFMFFRLEEDDLQSVEQAVASVNLQVRQQIKGRVAQRYANLLAGMRLVPLSLYERMVDVASNGRLSSFGYSDLGFDRLSLSDWMGCRITRVRNYPPVPVPPGVCIVVTRAGDGQKVSIGYGRELFSDGEAKVFSQRLSDVILHSPIP